MNGILKKLTALSLTLILLLSMDGGVALAAVDSSNTQSRTEDTQSAGDQIATDSNAKENDTDQSSDVNNEEQQTQEATENNTKQEQNYAENIERDAKRKAETNEEQTRTPKYRADMNIGEDSVAQTDEQENITSDGGLATSANTHTCVLPETTWASYYWFIFIEKDGYRILDLDEYVEAWHHDINEQGDEESGTVVHKTTWAPGDTIVIDGSKTNTTSDGNIYVADGVENITIKCINLQIHYNDENPAFRRYRDTWNDERSYYSDGYLDHRVFVGKNCKNVTFEFEGTENYILSESFLQDKYDGAFKIEENAQVNIKVNKGSRAVIGDGDRQGRFYYADIAILLKKGAALNISGEGELMVPGDEAGIYGEEGGNRVVISGVELQKGDGGNTNSIYLYSADSSLTIRDNARLDLVGDDALADNDNVIEVGSIEFEGGQIEAVFPVKVYSSMKVSGGEIKINVAIDREYTVACSGNIDINGGKININQRPFGEIPYGIYAAGNINLNTSEDINVYGEHTGIKADGKITIGKEAGTINVTGNDEYAMTAGGSIDIQGGKVTASLKEADDSYATAAVRSFNGDITISNNANITANAGKYDNDSAFMAAGAFTVNGGKINATGHKAGIDAKNIQVNAGELTVKQVAGEDPDDDYQNMGMIASEININGGTTQIESQELAANPTNMLIGGGARFTANRKIRVENQLDINDAEKVNLECIEGKVLNVTGGNTTVNNTDFLNSEAVKFENINISGAGVEFFANSKEVALHATAGMNIEAASKIELTGNTALKVDGDLTVSGGFLSINSGDMAKVSGTFTVRGGDVEIYGASKAIEAGRYNIPDDGSYIIYECERNDFNLSKQIGTIADGRDSKYIRIQPMQGDYVIHFNKLDASVSGRMEDQFITKDESLNLVYSTFSNSNINKYFYAWNTNVDGTGASYIDGQQLDSQEIGDLVTSGEKVINLYAEWDDCEVLDKDGILTVSYSTNEEISINVESPNTGLTAITIDKTKPILITSGIKQIIVEENVPDVKLRLENCVLGDSLDSGLKIAMNSTVEVESILNTKNSFAGSACGISADAGSTLNIAGGGSTEVFNGINSSGTVNIYGGYLMCTSQDNTNTALKSNELNVKGGKLSLAAKENAIESGNINISGGTVEVVQGVIKANGDINISGNYTLVEVAPNENSASENSRANRAILTENGSIVLDSATLNVFASNDIAVKAYEKIYINNGGKLEVRNSVAGLCANDIEITGEKTVLSMSVDERGILAEGTDKQNGCIKISEKATISIITAKKGESNFAVKAETIQMDGAKFSTNSGVAIHTTDSIDIKNDSYIDVNCGFFGIKSYDEQDISKSSSLVVDGSTIKITSGSTAIFAQGNVEITDSSITVKESEIVGYGLRSIKGNVIIEGAQTTVDITAGSKAIFSNGNLEITGGNVTVKSSGADGLKSESGDVIIEGAQMNIIAGSVAIHSNGNLEITDANITANSSSADGLKSESGDVIIEDTQTILNIVAYNNGIISEEGVVKLKAKKASIYGPNGCAISSKKGISIVALYESGLRSVYYQGSDKDHKEKVDSVSIQAGKTNDKYIAIEQEQRDGFFIDDGSVQVVPDVSCFHVKQGGNSFDVEVSQENNFNAQIAVRQRDINTPTENTITVEQGQGNTITFILTGINMENNEKTPVEFKDGNNAVIEKANNTVNKIISKDYTIKHYSSISGNELGTTLSLTGNGVLEATSQEDAAIFTTNKLILDNGSTHLSGIQGESIRAYDMEIKGRNTMLTARGEGTSINLINSFNMQEGSARVYATKDTGNAIRAVSITLPSNESHIFYEGGKSFNTSKQVECLNLVFDMGNTQTDSNYVAANQKSEDKIAKVHFDKNFMDNTEDEVIEMEDMEITKEQEGQEISLTKNQFEREGYLFAGWSTNNDGPVEYLDESKITLPSGMMVLYAQWIKQIPDEIYIDEGEVTVNQCNFSSQQLEIVQKTKDSEVVYIADRNQAINIAQKSKETSNVVKVANNAQDVKIALHGVKIISDEYPISIGQNNNVTIENVGQKENYLQGTERAIDSNSTLTITGNGSMQAKAGLYAIMVWSASKYDDNGNMLLPGLHILNTTVTAIGSSYGISSTESIKISEESTVKAIATNTVGASQGISCGAGGKDAKVTIIIENSELEAYGYQKAIETVAMDGNTIIALPDTMHEFYSGEENSFENASKTNNVLANNGKWMSSKYIAIKKSAEKENSSEEIENYEEKESSEETENNSEEVKSSEEIENSNENEISQDEIQNLTQVEKATEGAGEPLNQDELVSAKSEGLYLNEVTKEELQKVESRNNKQSVQGKNLDKNEADSECLTFEGINNVKINTDVSKLNEVAMSFKGLVDFINGKIFLHNIPKAK